MTPAALLCWLAILASPALIWYLAPRPVRLHLRATILWLPGCLTVCTLLPALAGFWLGAVGMFAVVYLLPFGCMALGMALGRRYGLCPLLPLACALGLLPVLREVYPMAGALCLAPAGFTLLGNAAGAYPRGKTGGR